MAVTDKAITDLTAASSVNDNDLLVIEQGNEAKSLLADVLKTYMTADLSALLDKALLQRGTIPNNQDMDALTAAGIYRKAGNVTVLNGPTGIGTSAEVIVIPGSSSYGIVQMWIDTVNNTLYMRSRLSTTWSAWVLIPDERNAVTRYSQMILNASQLSTVTGGTMSADDLPANSIVCIGANAANLGGINFPVIGGAQYYTILTIGSNSLPNSGGNAQIAVGIKGMACRWRSGTAWGDWKEIPTDTGDANLSADGLTLGNNTVAWWQLVAAAQQIHLAIIEQPEDAVVAPNTTAVFTVVAYSVTAMSYSWQWLNASGEWTDQSYDSFHRATLVVNATQARNGYKYRCAITDEEGNTVISNPVTLTVTE